MRPTDSPRHAHHRHRPPPTAGLPARIFTIAPSTSATTSPETSPPATTSPPAPTSPARHHRHHRPPPTLLTTDPAVSPTPTPATTAARRRSAPRTHRGPAGPARGATRWRAVLPAPSALLRPDGGGRPAPWAPCRSPGPTSPAPAVPPRSPAGNGWPRRPHPPPRRLAPDRHAAGGWASAPPAAPWPGVAGAQRQRRIAESRPGRTPSGLVKRTPQVVDTGEVQAVGRGHNDHLLASLPAATPHGSDMTSATPP